MNRISISQAVKLIDKHIKQSNRKSLDMVREVYLNHLKFNNEEEDNYESRNKKV